MTHSSLHFFSPAGKVNRPMLAGGLLAVVGLVFWVGLSRAADGAKPGAAAPKPALTVTLTQASLAMVPIQLAANGNISAWQEASVGAEVAGLRIQELYVNVGDVVRAGQLLATLDDAGVQADVALARAALQEAQALAAEAAANAERARSVQTAGVLSAQQISQYLTQEQTAKARVESAKAQWDAQQLRLKHTKVLAPDRGIISARSASVGAVAGVGSELFRLIRQGRLEWRAEVTSTELARISKGGQALLTAANGKQHKGLVRIVSPTVDPQTRNGLVYVDIPSGAFKPGMFARGAFDLGRSSALTVLQSAVVVRDGFSFVYSVGTDNRVQQRKVQTGRMLGETIEIVQGISPQERLVATGAGFLTDGDLVRVVQAPATAAP
jgi:RND family efflux transporter MFP subunit